MAACVDQELLLGGLVDGELDAANTALVEAHVARCDGCREELERLQAVRTL
ncbi:MAG: anti-sigma factor family protein, partial [Sphingomicrobium sp.]